MKQVWIYGLNPVLEALRSGRNITEIFLSSGRHDKVALVEKERERKKIPVRIADIDFFNERFPKGHQGVAARVEEKEYAEFSDLLEIPSRKNETPFFLIIDLIEDPRNLGAIMRSAEAAGVHGVIIQSHRSAGLGPEVSKASAGAVEYIPVSQVNNIKHAIAEMKEQGITIVGAETDGKIMLWDADFAQPVALVVGSEGKGLRKTVADKCDFIVSLPIKGKVDSLNASAASAVLIFEVLRQRTKKN